MGDKVKVGVIGIGFMGSTHFRIHQQLDKADVVAIADINEKKLQGDWSSIVANIGDGDNTKPMDLSGVKTYTDGMDLINDPDIDMVDICVPTFLHKKYAVAALQAGKHVLCEKPLGRTSADAKEILEEAKKSKGFFSTGLCIRYWPEYQHAYKLYKSGELGKVKSATFKRTSPSVMGNAWENWYVNPELCGGALLDLHLHDTDFVQYMFGKPESVTSFGVRGVISDNGIDHAVTKYNYADGKFVTAEVGWESDKATPFEMSFQIVCEKGTIRLSETGYKIIRPDGSVEEPTPADPKLPTGWHVELDYIHSSILSGKAPVDYLPLEEMSDAIAIIEAEEESIDKKSTVEIKY